MVRVFFTTPVAGKPQHQSYIDEIMSILHKSDVAIISTEDNLRCQDAFQQYQSEGLKSARTHYAFVTRGIAEADIVIIEASHEDFQVGHEVTLALLYGKPTLVLSQQHNYAHYIPHELLLGVIYQNKRELRAAVKDFLFKAERHLMRASQDTQGIGTAADSLHRAALATSRHDAQRDDSEFGEWARLGEKNPDKAYSKVLKVLGDLPAGDAWSAFASIYNRDTPDYIFSGVAQFIQNVFIRYGIRLHDPVADVATGTGALSRNLFGLGYRNIITFDTSREMLAEAFRLSAHLPSIRILEANIRDVRLSAPVKGMAWIDYSSNFALTSEELQAWLQNLLQNIATEGCLIFDVRTLKGWKVDFFHQKVATYSTDSFQRISRRAANSTTNIIELDIFIRTRQIDGAWGAWRREQMTERMWSLEEVKDVIATLGDCQLETIYGDTFSEVEVGEEPGLAYFVLKKT